jgi:hypothetical protein
MNDYSEYIWTRFSAGRTSFRERLARFIDAESDSANRRVIKKIKIDRASEFVKEKIKRYCALNEIELEYSFFYDQEQNKRAKRANRTLQNMTRTMLIESELSEVFWAKA